MSQNKSKSTSKNRSISDQSHINESESQRLMVNPTKILKTMQILIKTVSLVYYQYRLNTRPAKNQRKPIKTINTKEY